MRPNISLGDTLAGLHAAFGTVMALLHRTRQQQQRQQEAGSASAAGAAALGQVVDAAISESIFNMLEGCVPGGRAGLNEGAGGVLARWVGWCWWRRLVQGSAWVGWGCLPAEGGG